MYVPGMRWSQQAAVEDYDALVLPGGVANPDAMRLDKDAVTMVAQVVRQHLCSV